MGCDIHIYIEYKSEMNNWRSFGHKINPGRYYGIFSKLVGVRNYYFDEEIIPLSEPKGLPDDVGYVAEYDNLLYVTSDEDEGHVSKEIADRWVKQGLSVYKKEHWVTHPDWHSHSWAVADDLEKVYKELNVKEIEWIVVYEILRSFEKRGYEARIVFWFDN